MALTLSALSTFGVHVFQDEPRLYRVLGGQAYRPYSGSVEGDFSQAAFFLVAGALGKGMGSLFREFVTGADSFGQLSSGIPNSILSGIVYWLIAGTVMAILFVITGWLIIGIGYQVGKIYRKYCWDIISIVVAITSTAVVIYFGEWIKNANPINLIVLLLLSHIIYIGIRCYVKDWMEERGYY